jgi:hypothetical protein
MQKTAIPIPYEKINQICQVYRVRELSLFGSVLTESFADGSDVDFLVEFKPRAQIGLLALARCSGSFRSLLTVLSIWFLKRVCDHNCVTLFYPRRESFMRPDALFLADMIESADAIQHFLSKKTRKQFLKDESSDPTFLETACLSRDESRH